MGKSAIVVIGYNNSGALERLLNSLNTADYENDQIPLIISLDKSDNSEVETVANEFQWKHGNKEIRTFEKRQGLKKHVLSCGEYLHIYDALYVFEDDTLAAESYYQYGKSCIEYYEKDERIAGIALYSPAWNQNANFPFEPIQSQYDTYFMKLAPSLGQIWLKKPWFDFIEWYQDNLDIFEKERDTDIPNMLYTWGKDSWLKYHIAYCAVKRKYIVYPYCSYVTDFVEHGTHFVKNLTRFQVNLFQGRKDFFNFAPLTEDSVCYDSFFENEQIIHFYKKKNIEVQVDLYGCQTITQNKRFVLTTQNLPYQVVEEFALQLRPFDLNVLMKMKGKGIFLYDMTKPAKKKPSIRGDFYVKRWDYFMRDRFMMWNEILPLCNAKIRNLLIILFRRLGK